MTKSYEIDCLKKEMLLFKNQLKYDKIEIENLKRRVEYLEGKKKNERLNEFSPSDNHMPLYASQSVKKKIPLLRKF